MNNNKKNVSKKIQTKKIIPRFLHQTLTQAGSILANVIQGVNKQIQIIERMKRQRNKEIKYAQIICQEYFQSYLNQMLADQPIKNTFKSDEAPSNIEIDSLAKASLTQISARSTSIQSKKIHSLIQDTCLEYKAQNLSLSKQRSVRLPLEIIEEMKTIANFRQRKIDFQLQKKRQALDQQERIKNQRKANLLAVSVNFDYNGKILYTKKLEQGNIIKKQLKEKLVQQKIIKKVNKFPQASQVLPILKHKSLKKNKSKVFEEQFTEFLDGQSLMDSVEITRGIRYSHNALVLEQKKSVASTSQLKSQLGRRKISKGELQKIKQFDLKQHSKRVKKMKTELFKQSSFSQKRSYSQANLNSLRNRKKRDTINVMNPQLRSSMLIRLSQYQPYLVIQKEFPQDSNLFYSRKQDEPSENLSIVSKKQIDSLSKIAQSVRMTPILPPINRSKLSLSHDDDLIITKLQQQLQNKLRL